MSRPATQRLKVNPPLGCMPALQYAPPSMLSIDHDYQRTIEAAASQALIRRIAQHWNWDLCLPLVVSRRAGDPAMYVIDGQHRLEAAKMRGDIQQLPCVVVEYVDKADEAASFVHLNQQRRPLSKIDLFKAALASRDGETVAIVAAMEDAGLSIAPHSNFNNWKPGMVSNIAGIQSAWRQHGDIIATAAMKVMARAYAGQVLRYAGTIFPGIVGAIANEFTDLDLAARRGWIDDDYAEMMVEWLGGIKQDVWRTKIAMFSVDHPNARRSDAAARVLTKSWQAFLEELDSE